MADLKLWTVEEANAMIPRVDALVNELRDAVDAHREVLVRVARVQHAHGEEAVRDPAHPEHDAYREVLDEGARARARVESLLEAFARLGVEVKDPYVGLVDFPAMRGADLVYLCWEQGEPAITHWHPLTTGYRDRQPLDDLVLAGGR